jgi:hypothetical protein
MSGVPGTEALAAPTNFPRSVDLGFDLGGVTNGVAQDFGHMLPDGTTTSYDNAKDYNSGFPAVNRGYTHTFLVNSAKFGPTPYFHEALCMIRRTAPSDSSFNASVHGEQHQVLSLSHFNRWLRTMEGRQMYGGHRDSRWLRHNWRFMGSVKRPGANASLSEGLPYLKGNDALPIVFAGRARILDIGRAYVPGSGTSDRPSKAVPGQRDHMFLLYRRYDSRKDMIATLENAGVTPNLQMLAKAGGSVPHFYWQADLYLNRSGQPPPIHTYTDEWNPDKEARFVGDYDHLGFINFTEKTIRDYDPAAVGQAREVVAGKEGFEEEMAGVTWVELFLAMH